MRYLLDYSISDVTIIDSDNKFSLCGELEYKFIDDEWIDVITLESGATKAIKDEITGFQGFERPFNTYWEAEFLDRNLPVV